MAPGKDDCFATAYEISHSSARQYNESCTFISLSYFYEKII